MFSQKGGEVLLKAMALTLPTYTMHLFRVLDTLCIDVEAMMDCFYWSGSTDKKKLHWRRWSKLCQPKTEDGLGFKDLLSFNKALLAKQGWQVVANPDSLVARVLKGKYYRQCDFLSTNLGPRPSYFWRSMI